ncbi:MULTISPECIES: AbrB/MazE/SpoVT family DNA-binding domain-containing protein [unclassified Idiomarina]|jgi:antitoxin component of MazEF toxin-antitoxin module|uniref:AbrB/MazE/SpoVT family DNA-binding domain-containing protein n=1 Tax=unclassified Idiomarina TaxID=2614829 RepID=UPI000C8A6364|nr:MULTISPECIES: AbrB/MazE/SpoVT family DNA-binding domain-containing protein [unclassified Idiomarina]MAD53809.1 AbrB family transcriptional regulator [Idiomarinaceae bacterium]|tara:strand:- start:105 stop:335 length:231 start_codon:yes stop_codon:yes gene_type:complete
MKTVILKTDCFNVVIIPTVLLKELNLDVNDKVEIKIKNGRILIEPVNKLEYSLEELLAQCEPEAMVMDEEDHMWLN